MTAIEPRPAIHLTPEAAAPLVPSLGHDECLPATGERQRYGVPFITALPLRLDVKVPMPNFRLKDLTHLAIGQVLETEWSVAEDLPVSVGEIKLLWAEFAVADQQLTVRVTRIA